MRLHTPNLLVPKGGTTVRGPLMKISGDLQSESRSEETFLYVQSCHFLNNRAEDLVLGSRIELHALIY